MPEPAEHESVVPPVAQARCRGRTDGVHHASEPVLVSVRHCVIVNAGASVCMCVSLALCVCVCASVPVCVRVRVCV